MRKPWLFLPAGWTRFLSPWALKIYSRCAGGKDCRWKPFHWRNMHFPNPLGTAGGIDKNALQVRDWQSLGTGFVEVGTVTPEPQKANPGKILDRSLKHVSLWNNMGFPNKGLEFVRQRLSLLREEERLSGRAVLNKASVYQTEERAGSHKASVYQTEEQTSSHKASVHQTEERAGSHKASVHQTEERANSPAGGFIPIFVNIGKNRQTPPSQAVEDYKKCMAGLWGLADAFVINISSPNTEGLRELFGEKALPAFLKSLKEASQSLALNQRADEQAVSSLATGQTGSALANEQTGSALADGQAGLALANKQAVSSLADEHAISVLANEQAVSSLATGQAGSILANRQTGSVLAYGQASSAEKPSPDNQETSPVEKPAPEKREASPAGKREEPPLILKISPDEKDFFRIIEQSLEAGIDGWCICNSTAKRAIPNLFPKRGGVSGKLLAQQSLSLLKKLNKYLSDRKIEDKLVISCGGALTAQDVWERLQEGANLVQVYSALVFEGPGFFQSVSKALSHLNRKNQKPAG